MNKNHILVIDDEPDIRSLVKEILEDEGYQVSTAKDAAEARKQFKLKLPDLVLLDIWMPKEDGISLLKECRRNFNNRFPIVMMSGHGTIETAVESTRLGAAAFLEKPLTMAKLLKAVKQMLPDKHLSTVRSFAGSSAIARQLRKRAEHLAASDTPLFIYGEASTGKASFAEYIHSLGTHANQAMVVLTSPCMISDINADSPSSPRRSANNTLLIRDIAAMSMQVQKALVKILSEKTVGRIIATADRKPDALSSDGTLLKPLAKLFEQEIFIPPIRDRVEDIPELLNACIDYNCTNKMLHYRNFSISAQNYLRHHTWPGNMKELDNLVIYLLQRDKDDAVSTNEARTALKKIRGSDAHIDLLLQKPLREAREAFERIYFEQLLRIVDGNIAKLAERSGMERTHVYRKLKSLGITLVVKKRT